MKDRGRSSRLPADPARKTLVYRVTPFFGGK